MAIVVRSEPESANVVREREEDFIIDSGASKHMTGAISYLHDYTEDSDQSRFVELGDKTALPVEGRGTIKFKTKDGTTINITNVLYVPALTKNLLSVSQAADSGILVTFIGKTVIVKTGNRTLFTGTRNENLYSVRIQPIIAPMRTAVISCHMAHKTRPASLATWHQRFGHAGITTLRNMFEKDAVIGLKYRESDVTACEPCELAKNTRAPFSKAPYDSSKLEVIERVGSDIQGPFRVATPDGSVYLQNYVCRKTGFSAVFCIRLKSETTDTWNVYKPWAEKQTGKKIKVLETDGGGEYQLLDPVLKEAGIEHVVTSPYTSQHNGVSERKNRTLADAGRSMLYMSGLPDTFWGWAMTTACYLQNRMTAKGSTTPFEQFYGYKPRVDHLRIFGCAAMAHVPEKTRHKLQPRATKCTLLGYETGDRNYILLTNSGKIIKSRDVKFQEDYIVASDGSWKKRDIDDRRPDTVLNLPGRNRRLIALPESRRIWQEESVPGDPPATHLEDIFTEDDTETEEIEPVDQTEDEEDHPMQDTRDKSREPDEEDDDFSTPISVMNERQEPVSPIQIRQSTRHRAAPVRFGTESQDMTQAPRTRNPPARYPAQDNTSQRANVVTYSCLYAGPLFHRLYVASEPSEPRTVKEALSGPQAKEWRTAMGEEFNSLIENKTWILTALPKGRKPTSCKWIFKIKRNADGSMQIYKARLVARGFLQREGIDYNETFVPVVKFSSLRLLFAWAVQHGLEIDQMDVVTAFFYGDMEEELYMAQPEGYVMDPNLVCKIQRGLYGFKQSPRNWYARILKTLEEFGLIMLESDNSVFMGEGVIIAIYVDDLIIIGKRASVDAIKKKLTKSFKMKDMGPAYWVLGIRVTRDREAGTISLDQTQYAKDVLKRYGMENAKPVPTPITNSELGGDTSPLLPHGNEYRSAIGGLMYLMTGTRPDLAYSISLLSQYMQAPRECHWGAVKRVLRYVAGTQGYSLKYIGSQNLGPHVFCDANWGGDTATRKSTSGIISKVSDGPVTWQSKRQPTVALSSMEAEYMALTEASKEAKWIRMYLTELGHRMTESVPIYCDNQGAKSYASNPVHHARTKHVDIKYHFVRNMVASGATTIIYVPTAAQQANIFTKALGTMIFKKLATDIRLL